MNIEKLNNVIDALQAAIQTPQITEVKLHSQHEFDAFKKQLEPLLKFNSYTSINESHFYKFAGVPIKLDLDVPPFFIRYYKSDGTFKDYQLFKQ